MTDSQLLFLKHFTNLKKKKKLSKFYNKFSDSETGP